MSVTNDELHEMGARNTICEAVLNVRDALKVAYPHATFYIVASDTHPDPMTGKPRKFQIATKEGAQKDVSIETTNIAASTPWLKDTCSEAFLNMITSYGPDDIATAAGAALHDAAIDYGKSIGLDIRGFQYCRDHPRWKGKLDATADKTIHQIGQKVTPMELEQHITQVRQELKRLEAMRNPATLQRMMADEVKRLKRKGEMTAATALQTELDTYIAKQQRLQAINEVKARNLANAREILRQQREKKKRQQQQNQHPQFNVHKAAKAKRQEIAARQAEKKKKKASASGSDSVRSCSPMLTR